MRIILTVLCIFLSVGSASAQENRVSTPVLQQLNPIPSDDYFKKSVEINEIRKTHLIGPDELLGMMSDKNTVLLDVRGDDSYAQIHIQGAKHLSFSDMTPAKLAQVIPSKNTRVVLYCDASMIPYPTRNVALSTEAYPHVYLHGYTNLYEVKELWNSDTQDLRRQYESYLKLPLEGDAQAIEYDRKYTRDCIASGKPPCAPAYEGH